MLIYVPLFYLGPFSLFVLLGNCSLSQSWQCSLLGLCLRVSHSLCPPPSVVHAFSISPPHTHPDTVCFLPHPNISRFSLSDSWLSPLTLHGSQLFQKVAPTPRSRTPEKPHICIALPPDCAAPGLLSVLWMTAVRLGWEILDFVSFLDPMFGTFN